MSLKLLSSAFEHNGSIPSRYTCDGDNISPPLSWQGIPAETKSLALIVDDPDAPDPKAPKRVWVHWLVFNIPASVSSLAAGQTADNLIEGAEQGKNDWSDIGYGGPCPPIGRHRYFHTLYALDVEKLDISQPSKAELEIAMNHHIIDKAELIGTYSRTA